MKKHNEPERSVVGNNRSVENAWKMLQYLYDELKSRKFKSLDISNIKDLDNLYAVIISKWCATIAKEGLYKEYVEVIGEEMTSPHGQIDINETIARQSRLKGQIVCNYDELSGDININHILKGTMQYIQNCGNIDKEVKNEIIKAMQSFNGIGYVDIDTVHWNDIRFNNNNMRYKHLIEMCKTLVFEHKLAKRFDLDDDMRLYLLFKKQLMKWFTEKYGLVDDVIMIEEPFTLENEPPIELYINRVQKLIAIKTDKQALIFCVRLQDKNVMTDTTLGRKQKEELVTYLRNFKKIYKVKTSGCMVYVNTDRTKLNLQPITMNMYRDYMVGETIVDIHDQWKFVENKLIDAYKYFIEREKNKESKINKHSS